MTLVSSLTPSETERIASIWHAALLAMPWLSAIPSAGELRRRLESDLSACHIALVRDGAQIVAFAAYDLDRSWLRQLFVHPAVQGSGTGTQLLAITRQAMPAGWLRTDEANEPARRFYARRGLRVRGTGPHPITGAPTVEFEWP